jgi:O-antigen/teichoic acid export membrane protein
MILLARLRQDELLSRVLQNSAHLFSSNSLALAFGVGQSILAARMLGAAGYGLVGIVMSYASTVNGLLSFRMSELVVRYGGKYLEQGDKGRAAALVRAAGAAELLVSLIAFVVVVATVGVGALLIAKTPGSQWMFIVYAIGLLANFNVETSTGVLQITNRIKARGTLNLVQSVVSAAIIAGAFVLSVWGSLATPMALLIVLIAYLAGKMVLGLGMFSAAELEMRKVIGMDWRRAPLSSLPSFRELFGFAFSSNLSATGILVFRESELLWVGLFLNSEAAGLYKIAYTVVGFLSVPADPLILSVYPETNRLIVQRAWADLQRFLRRITSIAFAYNAVLAIGLVLAGHQILRIFGDEYAGAYPALLALVVGLTFNYTLFWNRPVLLSLGLQNFALLAVVIAGVSKIAAAVPLVPRFGFAMEGALLSMYYIISVGLMASKGLIEVQRRQVQDERQAVLPARS